MPIKHSIPFRTKLHAVGLVDAAKQSLRKVSMIIGVAKSTLHDNLNNYRSEASAFEQHQSQSERRLVRDILLVSFEGKTSARDCANIISAQTGQPVSHQKVLKVLSEISIIAAKKNIEAIPLKVISATEDSPSYPLANVKCGAFDEIFQKKNPILGFVDQDLF